MKINRTGILLNRVAKLLKNISFCNIKHNTIFDARN